MHHADPIIPHRIERTRNRHSRAVYRGNEIVIRLARNLNRTEEQKHIEGLLRRMTKHVQKESRKKPIDPFRSLLEGSDHTEVRLADGTCCSMALCPGIKTHAQETACGWKIFVSPTIRQRSLHRFLWSLLAAKNQNRIITLVQEINRRTFSGSITSVRLAYASTQWGSCSRRGRVSLNAALLFVPGKLLRYVIIHELAHIGHPNHSASYWRSVERHCPDYRELRRALLMYRLPTLD